MSTLFVVATPLGNLEDMTARAERVLREVDVLFAEDTRRTRALLGHLGISRALESLHEHNERERVGRVLSSLAEGKSVALVSDAGTPVVSDPGAHLIAEVKRAGHSVSPVVGPSALAAALSVSGFRANETLFVGFVAHKGKARSEQLNRIAAHRGTVVLFESPHRLEKTLRALASAQPERPACVVRELTKLHEEVRDGTVAELGEWAAGGVKGEVTVVLGPVEATEASWEEDEIVVALEKCAEAGLSTRDAVAAVAALEGRPRREVYRIAQAHRIGESGSPPEE